MCSSQPSNNTAHDFLGYMDFNQVITVLLGLSLDSVSYRQHWLNKTTVYLTVRLTLQHWKGLLKALSMVGRKHGLLSVM